MSKAFGHNEFSWTNAPGISVRSPLNRLHALAAELDTLEEERSEPRIDGSLRAEEQRRTTFGRHAMLFVRRIPAGWAGREHVVAR